MRVQAVTLTKQTLIYGIGAVALQVVGVLTLPIYARVFAPAEYGVIEIVTITIGLAATIVDAGFAAALQRSYFDYTDAEPEPRATVVATALAATLAIGIVVAIVLVSLRGPLAEWLFGDDRYQTAVTIAAVALPVTALASLLRQVMRLRFKPWQYLTSAFVGAVIGTAISLTAVLAFDRGVEAVFIGTLCGSAFSLVYGAIIDAPFIGRAFSRPELRTMLAYGIPLIPAALAMWALQFVDRIMLSKLATLSDVGQYAVANRVTMPLLLLVTAFGTAYAPWMLSMHAEDPEGEKLVRGRILTYVVAGLVVAAVALSLFAHEVVHVLAPRFEDAYKAVWLVAIGMVAFGATVVTMAGIGITRRTKYLARYSVVAAAVNIGLNFVLIPPWGMVGAATATAAAYLLLTVLYYVRAQRLYPTPYEPGRVIAIGALGALLMPVGLVAPDSGWLELAIKLSAFAVMLVGLAATGIVGRDELKRMRAALRNARGADFAEA